MKKHVRSDKQPTPPRMERKQRYKEACTGTTHRDDVDIKDPVPNGSNHLISKTRIHAHIIHDSMDTGLRIPPKVDRREQDTRRNNRQIPMTPPQRIP